MIYWLNCYSLLYVQTSGLWSIKSVHYIKLDKQEFNEILNWTNKRFMKYKTVHYVKLNKQEVYEVLNCAIRETEPIVAIVNIGALKDMHELHCW